MFRGCYRRGVLPLQFCQKTRDCLVWIDAKEVGIGTQKRNEIHLVGQETVFSGPLECLKIFHRDSRLPLDIFQ